MKKEFVLSIVMLLNAVGLCQEQGDNIWQQETLANDSWGLNDRANPGGSSSAKDATVFAIRVQMTF